ALKQHILPLATFVTPNHFEALTLSGMDSIESVEDLAEAARRIHETYDVIVLAKGGVVLDGPDAVDVFYDGQQTVHLSSPKIGEHRVSGAGCTLAAAVTAELAKGAAPLEAAQVAEAIVTSSIENRQECHTSFDAVFQGVYQRWPRRARVPRGPGRLRGTRARLCMPALSFWREGRRAGGRGTSRWW